MNMNKLGIILFTSVLFFSGTTYGQNREKMYNRGLEAFFKEDFEGAIVHFEELHATGKPIKDSEYRLEVAYLIQPANREKSLEKMLKFERFKSQSDKFFYYWMGRIYANKYMFPEAVDAWNKFLNRKNYKSEEIVEETKGYLEQAELLVTYFDNPDNFEIHQLESPINTEFAEMTPVYSEAKDELLFASNRANPDKDAFKIYHSKGNTTGWSAPTSIDVLGTFEREQANVEVVNEDGKLFIFQDVSKGDLFYSQPGENGWNKPVEFDSKITSTHLESHFYINEHEDRIIFSTKNKDTGLDLMESFRDHETGEWEKPHPFALNLNTEFNEDSPFLSHDEKKFYFLSDRPGGVGGYDVYVSNYDDVSSGWSEPVNMGWPINSPDDEIHFKMNPDETSGYFSSNRIHSKGDYDIFFFWKIEKTKIRGRVINALTEQPVSKGEIRFHPSQYLDEYFRSPLDSTGKYSTEIISNEIFRVEVINYTDTLMTESFEIHDAERESITHHKDFYVIPKDLSEEQKLELKEKFKEPEKEEPVQQVTQSDKSEVEKTKEVGKEEVIKEEPPMKEVLTKTDTPPTSNETSKAVTSSGKPARKKPIFVGNIYFEFGTSKLTDRSLPRLNEILTYLNTNSQAHIEIGGHTDNIGAERTNQAISKNRAESAKRWLVEHGVDSERISTVGYGSQYPMASNDDEKNGRELNRRIEITLKN